MGVKNTDRRVVRTKKAIRGTFEQMIIDMDYPDITIKELTQRAGINRKTFYLHYATLEELFNELADELVAKMTAAADNKMEADDAYMLERMLSSFHGVVMENPPLHEKLMFGASYQFFFTSVSAALMKKWLSDQLPKPAGMDEIRLRTEFISAGILASYRCWFAQKPRMAKEQLLGIIVGQIRSGLGDMVPAGFNIR